jgi:hypothetical protein
MLVTLLLVHAAECLSLCCWFMLLLPPPPPPLLLLLQSASRLALPYSSAWDCAVTSWRQEGYQVFVRGLGATMGRGFVVNAAIFAAFEACMDAMST